MGRRTRCQVLGVEGLGLLGMRSLAAGVKEGLGLLGMRSLAAGVKEGLGAAPEFVQGCSGHRRKSLGSFSGGFGGSLF